MYEASKEAFSKELFQNPTSEYRGAPFWSWNGKIKKEVIEKQILVMKEMGFGGFHIHSRIGLETEYLGDEFMDMVKYSERFAAKHGMLTWLYDEDKWPSGAGGGRVACDPEFAECYLLFSPNVYTEGFLDRQLTSTSRLSKNGEISLLCRYEVNLENGRLVSYRLLNEGEETRHVWYAYRVVTERLSWFNNQPYADTLNPKAVERFLEVTHERYNRAVGEHFSKTIPAIFTDEPSFHMQEELRNGDIAQDVGIAYTDGMEDYFKKRYGHSLLESLPEIFWERADGILSRTRYEYHDCVAWMFAEAYGKTISDWCCSHNLFMTGHLLFEERLESQSRVVGEVMRTLRYFTLPGVDMLADRHEYTTVKEASSIARQYGRPGVLSELYGVTNWDFDFRGHKHQGDWQAALGVTVRVHHLIWMTMKGEAKRDYPSPIDEHTTWYKKYRLIEDYFARINTVLTRGKACCRIALIHPVESYWMLMGPSNDTAQQRQRLEEQFQNITEWLLFHLLDYDYISEALLPELYMESEDGKLHLGQMAYETVVVPGMITLRKETLRALQEFSAMGGKVIFMGEAPSYVDGVLSGAVKELSAACKVIGYEKYALLEELEAYRDVEIKNKNAMRSERLIYQLRQDGNVKWLFLAQGKQDDRLELSHWITQTGREDFFVGVRGIYTAERFEAATGESFEQPVMHKNGWTWMQFGFYAQDAYLICLKHTEELRETELKTEKERVVLTERYLPSAVEYSLEEPNVLLLDQAEYCLDGGQWQPREEILRIDAAVRNACGYMLRTASTPQPWLESNKAIEHTLILRYRIRSEVRVPSVDLAFELEKGVEVVWNGKKMEATNQRCYVDECIRRETLGVLNQGENILLITIPFGPGVNLETGYLLGDFGVRLAGDSSIISAKADKIQFGNLVYQGLPFYGGNLTYRCTVMTDGSDVELEIPEYCAALLHIQLDCWDEDVYAEPYRVVFRNVPAGKHSLAITMYGSRINTFGQVHNCNRKERYWGNKTWRTTGKNWSYIYQLRQTGVMVAPILRGIK